MWKNDPAVALPRGLHEGVGSHAVGRAEIDALGVVPILTVCIDLLDFFPEIAAAVMVCKSRPCSKTRVMI